MFSKVAIFVFIVNALFFFFQALTKNIYPPLLVPIREEFSVGHSEAGLLVTLVFLGYALARFPSGVLADVWGCTRTILWGSLGMAVSFLAVALSPEYYTVAFFTFILGISSGIYVTAGYTLAVIIGSRSRAATATAAFESFGAVAGIISPMLVTAFVLYFNWPLLFVVLGGALGVLTLLFLGKKELAIRLEDDLSEVPPSRESSVKLENSSCGGFNEGEDRLRDSNGNYKSKWNTKTEVNFDKPTPGAIWEKAMDSLSMFRDPEIKRFIIWSTLVGGLGAITWTGVNSFIPTFLVEERDYSYDRANLMYTLVAISGLLFKVALGWLADRFGSTRVLALNLFCVIVLFWGFTLLEAYWQLLLLLVLIGAACLNTNTLINAHVLRYMPARYQGTGFGLFCTAYTVIYSTGPYLTGFFSELVGLSRAIQLSTMGAAIALVLILLARYAIIKVEIGREA